MKLHNSNSRAAYSTLAFMAATLLSGAAILGPAFPAQAGPGGVRPTPGVLPPHSMPYGHSYGEWAVSWWQWALSIPADRNPVTDTTGEFAGESQEGPVWYVAGTFGDSVERSYTVPAGKALFMPVYNWIFGAGVFDCEPTVPGVPCCVTCLQAAAAENTEAADILDVYIDGVKVENMRAYRGTSPTPFPVFYPENSVFGVPSGIYEPNVADGYWLMIAPLPKGEHEIQAHVRAPGTIFGTIEFEVVYHITVN